MAQRGRPRKMKQLESPTLENPNVEGEAVMADEMKIKHLVYGINKRNTFGTDGDLPAPVVEQKVNEYLVAGWKLNQVYMIANDPNFINLLYILTKE